MSTIRRDRPASIRPTPLNSGIDPTPTSVFDPVAQRDAARANADRATRCHYLKPSGERCGSPAMHGFELCYYHDRYRPKAEYRNLPCLEDPHSVQCAIQEVIEDMLRGYLDYKKAALALYGLQTAASNLKQMRIAEEQRRKREEQEEVSTVDRAPCTEECPNDDDIEEIELIADAQRPTTTGDRPTTPLPSTVHGERFTPLIESPRPPQRITQGLLTKSEREARDAHLPDLEKLRAEILRDAGEEERELALA